MTKMTIVYEGDLCTKSTHSENDATILTDAPKDNNGKGLRFSPTDLFAVSLGSCILTIMGMYANKLGVELKGTRLEMEKEMATNPVRRIGRIKIDLYSPHEYDDKIKMELEKAIRNCPVHHSLHPDVKVEVECHWGRS